MVFSDASRHILAQWLADFDAAPLAAIFDAPMLPIRSAVKGEELGITIAAAVATLAEGHLNSKFEPFMTPRLTRGQQKQIWLDMKAESVIILADIRQHFDVDTLAGVNRLTKRDHEKG